MLCFGRKKRKQSGLLNNEATAVTDYPDTTNAVDRNKGRPASASQVYPVVQENDQSNRQHNPHEQCKNRQKASNDKVDELRAKMKRLKKERKEKKEEMTKLKDEHLRTMENQNKEHQRTVEKLQEKVSRQKIDNQELKDANNELLTRLSAMAGARLTDGNANIADLSDENRPTKLAERYSELYDNEWTDAFEVLTAGEYVSEQDACHTLCEALCAFYNACKKKANGDLENMREAIKKFLGGKEPPSELMKPLKDQRKKIHGGHIKHLKSDLKDNIHKLFPDKKKRHDERLKLFLNKGIELCWLMVIQDPSVYLDVTSCNRYGEKYESTTLKPYTQSGQYIDYIVWPPLYLNEGGNILCKGIAQCKSGVTNRISCNARPPTSEQQEITRATKTETELQESIKETKNSETKLEGATLSVSDSYHNDRYTDPGTCSNQKESNHAKPISVGILSVTENENRSELPVLDEMLTTNEVNKHDAKTNITTVTETDGQEKMGAIDNSEFPSEVNLTDSKANFSKLH